MVYWYIAPTDENRRNLTPSVLSWRPVRCYPCCVTRDKNYPLRRFSQKLVLIDDVGSPRNPERCTVVCFRGKYLEDQDVSQTFFVVAVRAFIIRSSRPLVLWEKKSGRKKNMVRRSVCFLRGACYLVGRTVSLSLWDRCHHRSCHPPPPARLLSATLVV